MMSANKTKAHIKDFNVTFASKAKVGVCFCWGLSCEQYTPGSSNIAVPGKWGAPD